PPTPAPRRPAATRASESPNGETGARAAWKTPSLEIAPERGQALGVLESVGTGGASTGTSGRRGMFGRCSTLLISAGVALGFSSGAQLPRGTAPPSNPPDARATSAAFAARPLRPGPTRGRETH